MTALSNQADADFDGLADVRLKAMAAARKHAADARARGEHAKAAKFDLQRTQLRAQSIELRRAKSAYLRSQLGVSEAEARLANRTLKANSVAQGLEDLTTALKTISQVIGLLSALASLFP